MGPRVPPMEEHADDCGVLPVCAGTVYSLAIDMMGDLLVTGGEAKSLQIWNLREALQREKASNSQTTKPAAEAILEFTTSSAIYALSLTDDGDMLAVGPSDWVEVSDTSCLRDTPRLLVDLL